MEFVRKLFDTDDFVARWACGDWAAGLAWTHMVADFLIFLSYAAIPAALLVVVMRRRDLPESRVWLLFVAFILSCGITHLVESGMFYFPVYRLSAVLKVITASVSMVTAVVLAYRLPAIVEMPGLRQLNDRLRAAAEGERNATRELERTRDQLEDRAAQMTLHARRFGEAIAAARAVACRWELESGRVVWEIGFADAIQAAGRTDGHRMESMQQVLGERAAAELRRASEETVRSGGVVDLQIESTAIDAHAIRMSARPEGRVTGQPRMMIGMFRIIPRRD